MEQANHQVVELRAPGNPVARKAIAYWAVRAAVGWLVVAGIQLVVMAFTGVATGNLVALGGTAVLALAHLAVMPRWRYRVHRWETTPDAVYTQSGWFNRERRIAPVSRIQTVDSQQGPLERLFGLSNVTLTTASARGPVHIHGLAEDTARQVVADVAGSTQATTGDAT